MYDALLVSTVPSVQLNRLDTTYVVSMLRPVLKSVILVSCC